MTKQLGFFFDVDRCIQCRTCEVACQSTHNVEPGAKWRQVVQTWAGEFPDVTTTYFSRACMHCGQPACVPACPTGAIIKRAEDGIVVVDRDKCNGCQACAPACPFDIPRFGSDGTMQKCGFCLELGGEPVCATHCPTGALQYGDINNSPELAAGKTLGKMPGFTEPALIIIHKAGADITPNMLV
jgi:Fe-S-cluster-containing dehydrogenase component